MELVSSAAPGALEKDSSERSNDIGKSWGLVCALPEEFPRGRKFLPLFCGDLVVIQKADGGFGMECTDTKLLAAGAEGLLLRGSREKFGGALEKRGKKPSI